MLYTKKPTNFNPTFEIVSCYCMYKNKILLLHRHGNKYEGNKWGPPAGKVEPDETIQQAMIRELYEETGITIDPHHKVKFLQKYYVKYPDVDFIYNTFKTKFTKQPTINIASYEHQEYQWATPRQALKFSLVQDEDTSIKLTFDVK